MRPSNLNRPVPNPMNEPHSQLDGDSTIGADRVDKEPCAGCGQRVLLKGAILAALNVIVFYQATSFEFVDWDDIGQVMNRVNQFDGISAESLSWAFSNHVGGWMTPLSWISLLIDRQLFGMNAGGYHLTNMLLHILTTWCLFAALSRLTKSVDRSFLVACLFAIHPLHVEPVAWVTGRWELVAGLFWATGLLLWSYFIRSRSRWTYAAVMVAYIAAVLGKPIALTFPFVLLLLDYWPLNRVSFGRRTNSDATGDGDSESRSPTIRSLILEKVPLFIAMFVMAWLAISVKQGATSHAYTEQFPLISKLGNAIETYVFYMWQTLWPHDLACFYPHPASIGGLSVASVTTAGILLAAVTIGVLISMRGPARLGFAAFGWFYYLGTFVPASGIVQVELYATADRYTYLPLTGLLIIVVWGLAEICERFQITAKARRSSVIVGLLLLVLVSCRQCATWRNSDTLWGHAAAARPSNYRAHSVLAYLAINRGDLASAEAHSAESVRMCPQYVHGPIQLGLVRLNQRRPAEAVELFRQALQHAPELVKPRIILGRALRESGQFLAAVKELEQALEMAPSSELAAKELEMARAAEESRSAKTEGQDDGSADPPATGVSCRDDSESREEDAHTVEGEQS